MKHTISVSFDKLIQCFHWNAKDFHLQGFFHLYALSAGRSPPIGSEANKAIISIFNRAKRVSSLTNHLTRLVREPRKFIVALPRDLSQIIKENLESAISASRRI